MTVTREIARQVVRRAAGRCEYCLMHQSLQGATFHIEHAVPRSRAGQSTLDNLALACPGCNLHKADRVDARDPDTNDMAPLFNPRTQQWPEHFRWIGFRVMGLTPTGRATVAALKLNEPRRIRIRQAETWFNLFPPGQAAE